MEGRNHACLCPPLGVMNNLAAQGPRCRVEMVVMGRLDIYGMARSNGLRWNPPHPPPHPQDQRIQVCRGLLTWCVWPAFILCFYLKKRDKLKKSGRSCGVISRIPFSPIKAVVIWTDYMVRYTANCISRLDFLRSRIAWSAQLCSHICSACAAVTVHAYGLSLW